MNVLYDYHIMKSNNGDYTSNLSGTWKKETNDDLLPIVKKIYSIKNSHRMSEEYKANKIQELVEQYTKIYNGYATGNYEEIVANTKAKIDTTLAKQTCQAIINFFTEFDFEPNFRFINTLSLNSKHSMKRAKEYVACYFSLIDHPNVEAIKSKTMSREFEEILTNLKKCETTKSINNRFQIFYGSQGTGKTTEAMKLTSGTCMVCHSAMLPSDLMEDFTFDDGKATFKPSALWNAMITGSKITLDEINLLPFESLRFLQSILDGKEKFLYKGNEIIIRDGFEIIGTMNLKVNGSIFNLPEPLVDRASNIRNYKLTAEQLMEAL